MFSLKERLRKTRDAFVKPLSDVFRRDTLTAEDEDDIEELLLGADVGVEAAERIMDALREKRVRDPRAFLRSEFLELLGGPSPDAPRPGPRVVIVIGVNGVGKTTSIAKLAQLHKSKGESVILAACDTFRAAAADQLGIWAGRVGVDMIRHADGGDPAAVAFDACNAARSRGHDLVIVDTAGRLHTRVNLMEELAKIARVCRKALGDDAVETLIALDATLGQNSLIQAAEFARTVDIHGIILTKLDSTARGGIVIAVKQRLDIPVRYIGVGEKLEDFLEFSPEEFVDALLE